MAKISSRQFDDNLRRRYRRRFGKALDVPAASTRLARKRREEIVELAQAVAGEYCPDGRVEPDQIARAKQITMSFGEYGDSFDGMLEHRAGRYHIFCNVESAGFADSPRARFTLAHELGHYYIDEHRNALAAGRAPMHRSVCEYESRNLAEQEADLFAAHLLLPQERFVDKARSVQPGLAGILSLAETFGTSLTSTAIRYAEANLLPCAAIKWNWNHYAWKKLSSAAFAARYRRTVEAPENLPPDSPTTRALAHEIPPARGYFQAGTTAATWFPRVQEGEFRDIIFLEQAIPLGRWGVLTFLYTQEK
ncbi:MAG: ImmA/IrrE family metallo-endopeptidase [Phycisphaerae bacterium]|nr:ImmA/IrrE family metallo-endopeptidase [Phycisphaerae bacterium]